MLENMRSIWEWMGFREGDNEETRPRLISLVPPVEGSESLRNDFQLPAGTRDEKGQGSKISIESKKESQYNYKSNMFYADLVDTRTDCSKLTKKTSLSISKV